MAGRPAGWRALKAALPALLSDSRAARPFCGKPAPPDRKSISAATALARVLVTPGTSPSAISATLEPLFTPATELTEATRSGRTEAT